MLILNFLASCAVFYFIMYFIVGQDALPSFRASVFFILIAVVLSNVAFLLLAPMISYAAILVAFVVQTLVVAFLFKTDFKQTALGCGIYQVYAILVQLLWNAVMG